MTKGTAAAWLGWRRFVFKRMMVMIADIWASFRRMPLWVQVWVALTLVPVNLASLGFLTAPGGTWIAVLAVGGMLLNVPIMLVERGLSKAMAIPHILIWTPLVVLILLTLTAGSLLPSEFRTFLWLLLAVDLISLGFDYPDIVKWLRGDRAVA